MQKFIETTGETRDAAIQAALKQLGLDRDDVSVEVLDNGKKGFLGIGATPARVRVTYEVPDEPVKSAEPVHTPVEKKKEEKPEKLEVERPPRRERRERGDRPRRERRERRPREERPITPSVPKERELIPVSEECMKKAEVLATDFVTGLLEKMGVEGKVTILPQVECDQLRIEISGPDMGPVIGRRGDTLDAIQYLGSLVLNNALDEHVRLSVDTENYRVKRRAKWR